MASIPFMMIPFKCLYDCLLEKSKHESRRLNYLSIRCLIFLNNRRLSCSMCSMSFSMKTCRSWAPSLVTSITLFSLVSLAPTSSPSSSNKDDLSRSNVGNLSIAAHCNAYTASASTSPPFVELNPEALLQKLEVRCWKDDLMLLPISANSILSDSISSVPIIWAIFVELNWRASTCKKKGRKSCVYICINFAYVQLMKSHLFIIASKLILNAANYGVDLGYFFLFSIYITMVYYKRQLIIQ